MTRLPVLLALMGILLPAYSQKKKNPAPVPDSTAALPDLDQALAAAPWRNIGPFRGGRAVTACGVPGNVLTYYMGAAGGGLWKTEDAGLSWYNVSDGFFRTGSVGAVAVAPSDPQVVYAGMGEHAPRGVMTSHGDGVYKSEDGGATWRHTGLEDTRHISELLVHPTNPDLAYVAAQGALYGPSEGRGIYKTEDGGRTWRRIFFLNETTGCADLSFDPSNPRILYAAMWDHQRKPWEIRSGGTGSGIYKSTDSGATWTKLEQGLPAELGKIGLSVSAVNPQRVYAVVESDSEKEQGGVFVSIDGGRSWTRASKDHRLVMRAWYYSEIFADPTNEHTVYVLNAPMLKSIDGGKSWTQIRGSHGDWHDLWINPENGQNMVAANDGGAAITFNGGKTWSVQSQMPTAQMYRIQTDNLFPYHIYGGQQDNSSVRIASRNPTGYSITERDWKPSAGGESAFLAFDPNHPKWVMGGSYQGTIELLNQETGEGKGIMQSPDQYLAQAPKDMRYRFNWNAPIVHSQHEPGTFFHAANVVFRTRDLGRSWTAISPDLTRNDPARQGKSGLPYTNEGAGGENYNTLSYLIESPHEPGVWWAGADDGLVHLTRDGGETWTQVTPTGLQECLINAIEVSPHDPATAYLATTRYKFNDHRPGLYKTTDYGATWTSISGNLPEDAFTRVVREDDTRRDLLFAGTERGLFLSFDGGKSWTRFQLNLPVCPITDLKVWKGNLIAATSGRSFWIFDDLALLRQWTPEAKNRLYQPADAYRVSGGSALDSNPDPMAGAEWHRPGAGGVNAPSGAVLYFEIDAAAANGLVSLEFLDDSGGLVRRFSAGGASEDEQAGKLPGLKAGLNRFVWDLRYPDVPEAPWVYIEGSYEGHKAPPGRYLARLTVSGKTHEAPFRILPNPMLHADAQDYEEQHELASQVEADIREMLLAVVRIRQAREQLIAWADMAEKNAAYADLVNRARGVEQEMQAWIESVIQPKSLAYDDVINFENKLSAHFLFLLGELNVNTPFVTQGQRARYAELHALWAAQRQAHDRLRNEVIGGFNQACRDAGAGPVGI